jgi:hypothetical protein
LIIVVVAGFAGVMAAGVLAAVGVPFWDGNDGNGIRISFLN